MENGGEFADFPVITGVVRLRAPVDKRCAMCYPRRICTAVDSRDPALSPGVGMGVVTHASGV